MAKAISILGSTGSIGTQTLDVARKLNIRVCAISANSNIEALEKQAREFGPEIVAVADYDKAELLADKLFGTGIRVVGGEDGLLEVASHKEADTVVTSMVGISGLIPTMHAILAGKNIALANKETLVTAGNLIMSEARKHGISIYPVDSEHSAIFQCLAGNERSSVSKIILTAPGGPFRGKTYNELEKVTLEQALKHPNWSMGSKITIDSATLMNKGLEVIEAKWLFDLTHETIDVIVHPQSIIHSMVEYKDGSIIAQLGTPDMRIPIQNALTYPERVDNAFSKLDLLKTGALTFETPDVVNFPCLKLAYDALKAGGTAPAVMNGANEVAVSLFLKRKIGFMDIPRIIEEVLSKHFVNTDPSLNDIIEVDNWARQQVFDKEIYL